MANTHSPVALFPTLLDYLERAKAGWPAIDADRAERLRQLADYMRKEGQGGKPVRLVFICTHNSRRSQMAQFWAAAAAAHYGLNSIEAYSGGTETTAFHPHAIRALRAAGFEIRKGERAAIKFTVRFGVAGPVLEAFSKTYDHSSNPSGEFAAVMTCSQAEAECPYVPGAAGRFSLPYDDPGVADGRPDAERVYAARCLQIATELSRLMHLLAAGD